MIDVSAQLFSDTITVLGLRIGTEAPLMAGDFGTPGTLNMSDGMLIVSGGGDSFELGRSCCNGTDLMNMTGNAVWEIQGWDPIIGNRNQGTLNWFTATSLRSRSGQTCSTSSDRVLFSKQMDRLSRLPDY